MKGQILGFDGNIGFITGEDNKRYSFTKEEWKENTPPEKGQKVDFNAEGENAKDIYLIETSNTVQLPAQNKEILSKAGLLGGLGIIGLFLGWIPLIGPVISLAGMIILLMGIYKISKLAPEKNIFRYFLYAYIVFPLVFIILGGVITALIGHSVNESILLALAWILIVIPMFVSQAIYYKKAFLGIYETTGVQLFETTAKMFYWGSLLAIIGIGIFIVLVAWIMAAVAFFSLRK